MTYCTSLADTARYVSLRKLQNVPKSKLIDIYKSKLNAQLNLATVNKVYATQFKNSWEYTVSFFNECALNLANVPKTSVNFASYCLQNSMIADVAHSYKVSGAPKSKAYAHFAGFNTKTPNRIIDEVYASAKGRVAVKMATWNSCMSKISD